MSPLNIEELPLKLRIADGLDGSGCHTIYNQMNTNTTTKNFILFCFKPISISTSSNRLVWQNKYPNSPFSQRPVFLCAARECEKNIRLFMEDLINPETEQLQNGISLKNGAVNVEIIRSMFDGKMAAILSGAGGASCQMCTATHDDLKDRELIEDGLPINRTITDAIQLFGELEDIKGFLSLPSNERYNLTHQPISKVNIIAASPLHSYTSIFRWFNLLVYHLHIGKLKWSTTTTDIKDSMKIDQRIVQEKTELKVDIPDTSGGTTSTGNVPRRAFSEDTNFIECVLSLIAFEKSSALSKVHTQLSAILRIFNSSQLINTADLGKLCKETYLLVLDSFPWASITPTLHKLLAHSEELIRDSNSGYGLKSLSEEGTESCNKLFRKYRENLSRKNNFESNIIDIFVRLSSQSDPVLVSYRRNLFCARCGQSGHTERMKCKIESQQNIKH